ncbi:SDR family oxidoreductase [Palleronia sediminis]|uniref:SDR family oxidoreductase n=1 Tax=Palleronia sediminis TaxID=2547833 RepID=A0A4V3B9Z5_9RHOB|nr:SDR family oxidoreductase [Palleronia sediminis]TDL81179.1 SDR family oxidoreductase [Palleronia sediminis]
MPTVLIAGGATGIGRASLEAFREAGHDVCLADIAAEEGAALCQTAGAYFVEADLSQPGAPAEIVKTCVTKFGGIDTLFANAAVLASAPLADWTHEMWEQSLAVNLSAPFFLVQAAAPALRRSNNPSVILTASTGALRGHARMPAYHATKSGLIGLARSLADELAPDGIRVNTLLPGFIDTPFNAPFWAAQKDASEAERALAASIPMRRQGTPADVAGIVTFLASHAARYVTGTQIVVDGGYSAV